MNVSSLPLMRLAIAWKELGSFLAVAGIALFLILMFLSWGLLVTACLMGWLGVMP